MKNINDIYKIPAGTEIFSRTLQLSFYSKDDLYAKIISNYYPYNSKGEPCYGMLQIVFQNSALQPYIGDDATGYRDKKNGEITTDWTKCQLIRTAEQERYLAMYEYEIDKTIE